ncbi:MAG: hypothetical protein J6Z74_01540 [Eubacterium sp.]|nr:hypothetical protein [Eubacterium sp.]
MKKSFVKTVCGIVLAGAMLAATGCGNTSSSASANNSTTVVEESTGEQFEATSLEANQVMILGKVLDIPFNYSKISKQLSLREEMTEKFNVKVPARGTLGNVFLDVAGYEGSYVEVTLQNTYTTDELPKLCNVSAIKVSADHCPANVVTLPSGITIGSSAYQITGQYGDPDKTIDEKTGFQYVYEVGDVTYTFAFDTDKDGLQAIEIVYSGN